MGAANPDPGLPGRVAAVVAVDLAQVRAVDRIAADLDELAWARRVQDPDTAAVLPDPRAERRRRLAASSRRAALRCHWAHRESRAYRARRYYIRAGPP